SGPRCASPPAAACWQSRTWHCSRCAASGATRWPLSAAFGAVCEARCAAVRLLFLSGSLAHGGAEHHAITLANRLAERGHECHLGYVKPESDLRARLRLQAAGPTFSLGASRYLDLKAVSRLATEVARIQPSALLAANG